MIHLLFIRHGATAGNLEKRYIGRTDEPLCKQGIAQIAALKGRGIKADYVFVSPMQRTRQTAQILFPGQTHVEASGFRETDFGIFEGKTARELSDNENYRRWVDSYCRDPIPEGESVDAFKVRCCQEFLNRIGEIQDQSTAAFVVHGGTIMAILEAYARPEKDFYSYHIKNGQVVCADFADGVIAIRTYGKKAENSRSV